MQIFKTKTELSSYLSSNSTLSTAFVPTMGALHKGHLTLIQKAKSQSDIVICSIFVNPTQFDKKEDFNNYPNTLSNDLMQLEKINCDVVYTPTISDLYGENEKAKHYDFDGLDRVLEGKFRKGHFDGVVTIIEKFFAIIKPQKAFFGQKDLQQFLIVKALTKKLKLPIEIICIPTVREKSGLAMSSRNKLLNKKELEKATILYKSLLYCRKNAKNLNIQQLKENISVRFEKEESLKLEYIAFTNYSTLKSISHLKEKGETAVCIAAFVAGVRLIYNIIL